jgi:hypothetical protein
MDTTADHTTHHHDPRGGTMRALVVYESMFGNTHVVADRVGDGLRSRCETTVVPVAEATAELVADADLLVVGGPTHVHGMTSAMSRKSAVEQAASDDDLELDPDAEGPGLRDWFDGLPRKARRSAAAFDTRVDASAALTGRASKGIARRLRSHGFRLVTDPESFLVDKQNHLLDGEADRATEWGESIARSVTGAAVS